MSTGPSLSEMDALVLAGGESRRTGFSKALLPLGHTTVIGHTLAALRPLFRRVLVVGRDIHSLDGLDEPIELLLDDRPERGPLVGLTRGLAASEATWCFVVGCDMPFLHQEIILRMAQHLDDCDILVPYLKSRLQSLHTFYSKECLPKALDLLDNGVTSLRPLFSRCLIRTMYASDFQDLDPDLLSFQDLDTMEDYEAAQKLVSTLPHG